MLIRVERRDFFPKRGLYGFYLGDTYPLCGALPPRSFLRRGATFRYFGARRQIPNVKYRTLPAGLQLNKSSSALYKVLCAATTTAACSFPREVTLSEHFPCDGSECDVESTPSVMVQGGDGTVAYYEYMRPPDRKSVV